MDDRLVSLVQAHIKDSMSMSEYYKELSGIAPTVDIQSTIMEMAREEELLANQFQLLHHELMISGYLPIIEEVELTGDFYEELINAINNELRTVTEFSRNQSEISNEHYQRIASQASITKNARVTRLLVIYVLR